MAIAGEDMVQTADLVWADFPRYLLELMATKLLCVDHSMQIIAMSATLMVGAI